MVFMQSDAPAQRALDGRLQRSEASRKRIVRAMLDLIGSGDVAPGAEAVAARAGVGLRTVFRHFENMETLYQEINATITAELRPLAEQPFNSADWRSQLNELVNRRVRIFERIMPFKIAAEVHRHHSPFLARKTAEMIQEQRAALVRIVPAKVRTDNGFVEALDLLLSFESWRRLRKDQKLSVARAQRTLDSLLTALLRGR
jgi:AcrR family transcriptional regulator